jgi:hypothetical protein
MKASIFAMIVLVGCGGTQHGGSAGGGGGGGAGGGSGPVPAEVRKTIEGALGPNARVTSEREGGKLIYEGARETKLEVEVSEQGQLLQTEVAIPTAALPDAVVKAFAGKAAIGEAEVVLRGAGVAFEIEVGGTEYVVDAAGNVLSSEAGEDSDGEGADEDRD